MNAHQTWMWKMSEHDTRDRHPTTLAAMVAVEAAYRNAGNRWRPSLVAKHLPGEGHPLAAILTCEAVAGLEHNQDAKSKSAVRQRSRFNWWLFIAVMASSIAAAIGGFQLYKGLTWATPPNGALIAGVQLAFLVIASLFWSLLWMLRPYRRWLADRGEAEVSRQKIFATVLDQADAASRTESSTAPDNGVPSVRQLAHESFRVALLDDQIGWFSKKATSARIGGFFIELTRIVGIVLLLSATAASGLAGLAQYMPEFRALLDSMPWSDYGGTATLLTILGSTVLTAAQAADSALLSSRNRARYRDMAASLASLREERLAAAQKACRSTAPAVGADDAQLFALRVRELLAIEHAEWKAVLQHSTQQTIEHGSGIGREG